MRSDIEKPLCMYICALQQNITSTISYYKPCLHVCRRTIIGPLALACFNIIWTQEKSRPLRHSTELFPARRGLFFIRRNLCIRYITLYMVHNIVIFKRGFVFLLCVCFCFGKKYVFLFLEKCRFIHKAKGWGWKNHNSSTLKYVLHLMLHAVKMFCLLYNAFWYAFHLCTLCIFRMNTQKITNYILQ